MPTQLKYFEDMGCYSDMAVLLELRSRGDGDSEIVLDKTIFYPQGGGQACDRGIIRADGFEFEVSNVRFDDAENVVHIGRVLRSSATIGQDVTLEVHRERRLENSRLQSGGHLLLNAMQNVGPGLIAMKGYHFPDGPYVEFAGSVEEADRDTLAKKMQSEVDRLVDLDVPISIRFVNPSELSSFCRHVPPGVPTDRRTRIVTIDDFSQPCGGTHVASTLELKGMRVDRIRSKKGNTRVSYSVPLAA